MGSCCVTIKQEGYGFAIGLKIPSQTQPVRIDRISYDPDAIGGLAAARTSAYRAAKALRESLLKCGPVKLLGGM